MKKILLLFVSLFICTPASAQIIGTLPYILTNGTVADANQVMGDFNAIVASVNAGAANAGVNTNITALNGLTTPINYTVGGSAYYIGATSIGSANAQIVASPVPSGFTLVTGKVISFIAGYTNTGAMTLNVNGTGATNVYRSTNSGPVPLIGGEVVAGNVVTATYDGAQYQIINQVQTATVPTGTVADFSGVTIPTGWLLANGAAVSRTTYALLFASLSNTSVAATTTIGNTSVVVPNSALFKVGWSVGGSNVTCNSTISSIPDGTHIVISATAGASGATTLTIGPYGQGDCSSTFNLPNFTGRLAAGVDGTTNITSATCTNSATLGSPCGAQTHTLTTPELAVHSHANTLTDPGHTHDLAIGPTLNSNQFFVSLEANTVTGALSGGANGVRSNTTGITITNANAGGGVAHSILNPLLLVYKIIKT